MSWRTIGALVARRVAPLGVIAVLTGLGAAGLVDPELVEAVRLILFGSSSSNQPLQVQ